MSRSVYGRTPGFTRVFEMRHFGGYSPKSVRNLKPPQKVLRVLDKSIPILKEAQMTDNLNGNGSGVTGILGVMVGALIVIGIVIFFMGGFGNTGPATKTEITVKVPAAPAAVPPSAPTPPK